MLTEEEKQLDVAGRAQQTLMEWYRAHKRMAASAALDALTSSPEERERKEVEAKRYLAMAEAYEEAARVIGRECLREQGLPI